MKTCDRCGYSGREHFHQAEGFDLCESCYDAWQRLLKDILRQFMGTKIRAEKEVEEAMKVK